MAAGASGVDMTARLLNVVLLQWTGAWPRDSIFDSGDLAHIVDGAQAFHDTGQVDPVVDQHLQIHVGELVVLVIRGDLLDIHPHTVDASGDDSDHATAILHFDAQFHRILADHVIIPAQRHQSIFILSHITQVFAALPMHYHAFLRAEVAFYGVAGDGVTALTDADGDRIEKL